MAQAPPALPKRSKEGTSILLRPKRSERAPAKNVRKTPGSVKTVIKSPTCPTETPNC